MSCPVTTHSEGKACAFSAAEKQERIWKRLQELHTARTESFGSSNHADEEEDVSTRTASSRNKDNNNNNKRTWPTYDKVMADIASADYNHTLTCPMDWIPPKKNHTSTSEEAVATGKSLCPYGAVCCVRVDLFPCPAGIRPYTGLLTPNTTMEHGLMRLSSAMKPPGQALQSQWARAILYATGHKLRNAKLFPTAALKIFRNGSDNSTSSSGNLLFGGSKIGQRETDYFCHCQCTSMTEQMPRTVKPFVRKFWQYSDYPLSLGISEFCTRNVQGEQVPQQDVNFPFAVILKPCLNLEDIAGDDTAATPRPPLQDADSAFDHFLDKVLTVPAGTALFDLYACADPHDVPDPSKLQRIGRISTTSSMLASVPNDGIFFKHQKKEDDYHLRPEWKANLQTKIAIDQGQTKGTIGQLVGWKLFEQHIEIGTFVDFEKDGDI